MEPTGGGQPATVTSCDPQTREWHREKVGSESQSRVWGWLCPREERSSQGSQAGRQHRGVQQGWGC